MMGFFNKGMSRMTSLLKNDGNAFLCAKTTKFLMFQTHDGWWTTMWTTCRWEKKKREERTGGGKRWVHSWFFSKLMCCHSHWFCEFLFAHAGAAEFVAWRCFWTVWHWKTCALNMIIQTTQLLTKNSIWENTPVDARTKRNLECFKMFSPAAKSTKTNGLVASAFQQTHSDCWWNSKFCCRPMLVSFWKTFHCLFHAQRWNLSLG